MARNRRHRRNSNPLLFIFSSIIIIILVAVIISNNLSAQGSTDPGKDQAVEYDGACFVAGNIANSPAPNFKGAEEYVEKVLKNTETGKKPLLCMYSATSEPYAFELSATAAKAGNGPAVKNQSKDIVASINKSSKLAPTNPGADFFEGILQAAKYLKSNGAEKPIIIVYGSGLSDSGLLDFATGNLLDKDPSSITKLLSTNHLPEDSLLGTTIKWYGIGETVKENSQEPLGTTWQGKVEKLYEAAFEYAGVDIYSDLTFQSTDISDSARSINDALWVHPTRVPGVMKAGEELHLDERIAKFEGNSAVLINRNEVIEKLKSFAKDFNDSPSLRLSINGYHAKCLGGQNPELSTERANTIKDILVSLGVDAGRMEVHGFGGPQDDREEGSCTSAIASEHRTVILKTIGD